MAVGETVLDLSLLRTVNQTLDQPRDGEEARDPSPSCQALNGSWQVVLDLSLLRTTTQTL